MNYKNFSKILFFSILLTILTFISSDKIVLPFYTKTYPFDPNDEFKFIFKNEIFTNIKIGTPPQNLELFLTMRTPLFILKNNASFPEYYKNGSSSSYFTDSKFNYHYSNDDVLKRGTPSKEKLFLKKTFDNNEESFEAQNFDFIYATDYKGDSKRHMAVLGLQFFSSTFSLTSDINFIDVLKRNRLITSYVWNMYYTSENEGYIVIGEFPHTYNSEKFNKDDLKQINVHQQGAQKVVWNLYFHNISYGGEKPLNDYRTGKFAPQYGVIFGPYTFDTFITKEFFGDLVNQKKCERKTYDDKHDYYVCDENIDLSKFKNIEFTEKEISSKKFILTKDDLFLKKNGKLYFLIVFGQNWKWHYSWTLGKPFMKKYNFLFDQDGKQIYYYEKKESESLVENKSFIIFLYIGIFILLIVIGLLGYYLFKLIKQRKKMLYELDDEFDYNADSNNEDNKNMNKDKKDEFYKFEETSEKNKFGFE